jgi:very-short-patch-repair endonuclease
MDLPFNPKLKERAKALRKAGMLHEALLWNQLKRKQFNGLDFDRQKISGNFIVDFFCAERAVVIEADGASHQGQEDYDKERDTYLNGLGLTVIRIAVKDILRDMGVVMAFLRNHPRPYGHPSRGGEFLTGGAIACIVIYPGADSKQHSEP